MAIWSPKRFSNGQGKLLIFLHCDIMISQIVRGLSLRFGVHILDYTDNHQNATYNGKPQCALNKDIGTI